MNKLSKSARSSNHAAKKPRLQKKTDTKDFTIVAIGASVGGLSAITTLLKNLPADTGMAYIYVQHLNADHKSMLPEILSKITPMKVQEIDDMELMKPNNVYIMPNDKIIKVVDGHIKLIPRPKKAIPISIDVLFSSLAETHKNDVVGIVLTGNGKDGTLGLAAIKKAGGITFAQDKSAEARSMPQSAIDEGIVDFILKPKQMALKLVQISKAGFPVHGSPAKNAQNNTDHNPDLALLLQLLHTQTGVDFSYYKMSTIKRRLHQKMIQSGSKSIKEYLGYIRKKDTELELLYNSLLINVTSFFRDKDAFGYLKQHCLPKLLKKKATGEATRIWVPACSTGQEAYTIAMIITKLQDDMDKKNPIQIFATDLSDNAIRDARAGLYKPDAVKSVPKNFLNRFFTREGENYRIAKEIREMCVFAPHNILRDPPFSRMDLISCSNLLIYFDSAAQKKVFSLLHFALKENGHLILGKAESAGTVPQLFTRIHKQVKIYSRKKPNGPPNMLELMPHFSRTNRLPTNTPAETRPIATTPSKIEEVLNATLLEHHMPACALVNKELEILEFRGPISRFLSHHAGKANLNILKMARPEFAFELRHALTTVIKTQERVIKSGIEIELESGFHTISLEVSPMKVASDELLLLIVFKLLNKIESPGLNGIEKTAGSDAKDNRIKKLTAELSNARAEMGSIVEAQETTHAELQAANEEIISTNEEFQTLNEELETSKEEIQASNEELLSTNHELQTRNDLLSESYEFSESIIATCHEPMLVLDKDFRVKSANKSFYKKFGTKREDTEGKYLFEMGNGEWNIQVLRDALNKVISSGKGFENIEIAHQFYGGERIMRFTPTLLNKKRTAKNWCCWLSMILLNDHVSWPAKKIRSG